MSEQGPVALWWALEARHSQQSLSRTGNQKQTVGGGRLLTSRAKAESMEKLVLDGRTEAGRYGRCLLLGPTRSDDALRA